MTRGHPQRVELLDGSKNISAELIKEGFYTQRDTTHDTRIDLCHPITNLTQAACYLNGGAPKIGMKRDHAR